MSKLEEIQPNAALRGVLTDALVTVISTRWFGTEALELTYKTPAGKVANELLYCHDESRIEVVEHGRPWSFDGDGALFRLVAEAQRLHLAHLFDPVLAVHTSVVDPLPHQITAVGESMLPRQPLRFLLADDPGAGNPLSIRLPDGGKKQTSAPLVSIGSWAKNDIVLGDASVSRRHALIANFPNDVWLYDLGSTHGIRVDGETVSGRAFLDGLHRFMVGRIEVGARADLFV